MTPRVYLDHAATTPCRREVVEAMQPFFSDVGHNASSPHAHGRTARAALDDARTRIAAVLGARPREIVFTSGGTESDNLAILGVARARRHDGRHAVTAATEHPGVLQAFERLREDGYRITVLAVDADGRVDVEAFTAALQRDTVFASIMLANNEIGTVAPIAAFAAIARRRGVTFHTDAVQAAGQLPLNVDALGVDLLSLSAHKFGGPKGVGMLFVRSGTPLAPLLLGGGQEAGLRSGTENVAGIVGMATALQLAEAERNEVAPRTLALRDALERGIRERVPDAVVYGAGAERLPNNLSVGFPGTDGQALLVGLDLAGISASAGSACASGATRSSHVLAALGQSAQRGGAVRFSLGRTTAAADIERVLDALPAIVAAARDFLALVGTT